MKKKQQYKQGGVYWDGKQYRKSTGSTYQDNTFFAHGGPTGRPMTQWEDMQISTPGAQDLGNMYTVPGWPGMLNKPQQGLNNQPVYSFYNEQVDYSQSSTGYQVPPQQLAMDNSQYSIDRIREQEMATGGYYKPYGYMEDDGHIAELKKGGIHIKPENRGKFTAYKKRTGKTTEEALHSKDPHVRQMANFARNAAKWKHEQGGPVSVPGGHMPYPLYEGGGYYTPYGIDEDDGNITELRQGGMYPTGGMVQPRYQDDGYVDTGMPEPVPSPYTQRSTGVIPDNYLGPDPATTAPWRQGMTDQQAQNNIYAGSTMSSAIPQQKQRRPYNQFNNLLGAGIMTASYFNNQKSNQDRAAWTRQQGLTGDQFRHQPQWGRGMYDQQGRLPTEPVAQPGYYQPKMQMGGMMMRDNMYQEGGVHDLNEAEYKRLLSMGYRFDNII